MHTATRHARAWRARCTPMSVTVALGTALTVVVLPTLCARGIAGAGSGCCTREGSIRACFARRHVGKLQEPKTRPALRVDGSETSSVCDVGDQAQTRNTERTWYSLLGLWSPRRTNDNENADYLVTDARGLASSARGGGKGRWGWFHPGQRAKGRRALEKAVKRADAKRAANGGSGEGQRNEALPTGLANQDNTCYLNSLVQTMYHTPGLKEAVFEAADAGDWGEGGQTLIALAEVFKQLDEGGRPASTLPLTRAMGVDPRIQQDAQEFGRFLFLALEGEGEGAKIGNVVKGCNALADRVHELFAGRWVNYIECVDVPFSKEGAEIFYDVPLDVKGSDTLQKSLDRFTEAELLQGENRWRAGDHGLQDARKGVRFVEFPPVLQFHLKRFQYDPYRDDLAKVNDRFEFPVEVDVSPWLSTPAAGNFGVNSSTAPIPPHEADAAAGPSLLPSARRTGDSSYALSAIVMHVGGPSAGHYYAYVRQKAPNATSASAVRWVKLDDARVTEISEAEVLRDAYGGGGGLFGKGGGTASAYMLQYVRDKAPVTKPANEESENPQP